MTTAGCEKSQSKLSMTRVQWLVRTLGWIQGWLLLVVIQVDTGRVELESCCWVGKNQAVGITSLHAIMIVITCQAQFQAIT